MNDKGTLPLNIILIGFMGCGKSTVGRELHHRLGYQLVDMDHLIELRAGKPITAIFEDEGEPAFREMETAVLMDLSQSQEQRRIISTGGGVVGRRENRELLKRMGYVVWLDAPASVIAERTARTRTRPLLITEDPHDEIRRLMAEREPLYQETAHLKLDTAGLDSKELATGILECARYFFSQCER